MKRDVRPRSRPPHVRIVGGGFTRRRPMDDTRGMSRRLAPMLLLRWRMNLLALPDDEARALGVDTRKLRTVVVAAATLMTAAAVAVSGIIGWVGLLIPHAARMLVGPDFGRLLPLAMLLGAAFLLAVDTLCRTIATIEVPPGVLTALIGTPFFLWLFALARRSW